jgi:hypothetical protein
MKRAARGAAPTSPDAHQQSKRDPKQPPRHKGNKPDAPAALPPLRPLKPRPGLFVALLVLFTLWAGFLIWMYIKTVHPIRGQRPGPIEPAEIQIIVPSTSQPSTMPDDSADR